MRFQFFDVVALEVDDRLLALCRYFEEEFQDFAGPAAPCPYRIELRPLLNGPNENNEWEWDAAVGDAMFRVDESYYVADRWGRKAEWFQPKLPADAITIRIEPDFTPYRAYYYVVLPLLKWFFNRRGMTFLHSSGVSINGHSIAVSGWGGTGKTNTLLGLIERGGEYLADDLIVVDKHGKIYPFPRSVNVYHYNIEAVPALASMLTRGQRIRARILSVAGATLIRLHPRLQTVVNIVQKRFSNTYITSKLLNRQAHRPVGRRASIFVLLYRAPNDRPAEPAMWIDTHDVTNACMANVAFEMRPIQDCYAMYSFLSGTMPDTVVHDVDYEIIKGFLRETRVRALRVSAGAKLEHLIISLAEADADATHVN